MGIYSDAALQAYTLITEGMEPLDAWNDAISKQTLKKSSREKGCPRVTFLTLAYGGYLKDILADNSKVQEGKLSERAIAAADYVLSDLGISKKELADYLDYNDRQGSYDIVLTLSVCDLLQQPK
ncbi:hypothetical protein FDX19_07345 [Citrobacter sp. wls619]|uniref:DUF6979 family protein n=1 Tax=Citrobacter sp. wls619 TaxID=2576432 RepID=UPI0010C9F3E7|nr:hypothetical protein [Citrobacter sp. wls619]TKV11111.1 hypothetical protein FDX19_07345 [Citrobacter sp. wls619]